MTDKPLPPRCGESVDCAWGCPGCTWGCPGCITAPQPGLANGLDTENSKPTNPKDAIGINKVPLHLWPETATVLGSMALLEGATKYGRANWRVAGVRASIYVDACRRHLARWFEGEGQDADSGVAHLGHALACLAILVDAQAAGKLVDDRQYPGGFHGLLDAATAEVQAIRERHASQNPHHWTIEDAELEREVL